MEMPKLTLDRPKLSDSDFGANFDSGSDFDFKSDSDSGADSGPKSQVRYQFQKTQELANSDEKFIFFPTLVLMLNSSMKTLQCNAKSNYLSPR